MKKSLVLYFMCILFILFWFAENGITKTKELERAKEKKSVSVLIQELKSDKKSVRALAAEELGDRGDLIAVIPLIEALEDKEFEVKWKVCEALGKIKDRRAIPHLIKRLKDEKENWITRKKAAEALVNIGGSEVFQPLVDTLLYECEMERKRENLLPPPRHNYYSADEWIEFDYRKLLENFIKSTEKKEFYIDLLKSYIKDDKLNKIFRYHIAIMLGEMMGEKDVIPTLIDCLKNSPRGWLKAQAASLLGKMKVREAIPVLKEALKDPYLDNGQRVSKEIGESMIKSDKMSDGMKIFSVIKIEKDGESYIIRSYVVRNAAAGALRDLGLKIIKKGEGYEVVE